MGVSESELINRIAAHEEAISGIKRSYLAYENPDSLTHAQLPCVLHYPPSFRSELVAHHNRWKNTIDVMSILFVRERQARGGRLKFLENESMPFLNLWREKFQTASVIEDLLSTGCLSQFFLTQGTYGAGGALLTHNGIEYIGCTFKYVAVEIM